MLRIITGVIGCLVMIPVCIFSGTIIWPLVLTFFSVIAVEEMLHCIGMHKEHKFAVPARIFALLPLVNYLLVVRFHVVSDIFRGVLIFVLAFFFAEQITAMLNKNQLQTEKLYSMIALVLYVVVCMNAVMFIRYIDDGHQEGKYIYLLVFFGAWFTDTFAYFTGRAIGKNLLAPEISPKKTVEGSIGGIISNMLCFAGYAWILRSQFDLNANIVFFAILGALVSGVGQFGDLFASGIKRHYGIKDFGKFFPGHGGVLDRVDSILAIAGIVFLVYAAFGVDFLIL